MSFASKCGQWSKPSRRSRVQNPNPRVAESPHSVFWALYRVKIHSNPTRISAHTHTHKPLTTTHGHVECSNTFYYQARTVAHGDVIAGADQSQQLNLGYGMRLTSVLKHTAVLCTLYVVYSTAGKCKLFKTDAYGTALYRFNINTTYWFVLNRSLTRQKCDCCSWNAPLVYSYFFPSQVPTGTRKNGFIFLPTLKQIILKPTTRTVLNWLTQISAVNSQTR